MADYSTVFGSLDNFRKGGVDIIDDDPKNYAFSNVFEVAARSRPYERVAVGKNFEYVIEAVRAEGASPWYAAAHDEFALCMDGVVEVGVNVGYYTLLACSLVGPTGRVTAFEANPAAVTLTRRSLLVNGFRDRATIIEMAVTDAPGTVILHQLDQRQGDSSLFDFSDDQLRFAGDRVTKVEVPSTSLDAFFDRDEPIDLIRIDVEGAEPLVFDGMRRI